MKIKTLFLFIYIILFFPSCKDRIPDNYGIYISSNNELITLKPQILIFHGNLMNSVSGLVSSSGSCFRKIDNIIVFEKDVNPRKLILSKLEFIKGAPIADLLGTSYIDVNLWTSEKKIEFNISPVEGKKDMYKLTINEPLDSGFYALHFGSLTNKNTLDAFDKFAYDFVLGSSRDPYQSIKEINRTNELAFSKMASEFLLQINELFNTKKYDEIRKIYLKPDKSMYNESEWDEMVEGFKNWVKQSGEIKSSKIISHRINDHVGVFYLQTEYEKAGLIMEELRIHKKDNSYFLTFIGTN